MDILKLAVIFEEKLIEFGFGSDAAEKLTQQAKFNPETKCVHCGKKARLAFLINEKMDKGISIEENWKHLISKNKPKDADWWPHDVSAFAVYLCEDVDCATATTLWNQA